MSINKLTAKDKRRLIRMHYEQKYQKLIHRAYEEYYNNKSATNKQAQEFVKEKAKFLVRERNSKLAELDQSTTAQVHKLYKELFE